MCCPNDSSAQRPETDRREVGIGPRFETAMTLPARCAIRCKARRWTNPTADDARLDHEVVPLESVASEVAMALHITTL